MCQRDKTETASVKKEDTNQNVEKTGDEIIKVQVATSILSDMGAEVRSRRDPEHGLMAAFIAASGAMSWGVAVLSTANIPDNNKRNIAIVAAAGLIILAIAITAKICRENGQYRKARRFQGNLSKKIKQLLNADDNFIPISLLKPDVGNGHIWSLAVVWTAAISSAAFCISIVL